jgi:hypothetical protein
MTIELQLSNFSPQQPGRSASSTERIIEISVTAPPSRKTSQRTPLNLLW